MLSSIIISFVPS